MRAYLLPPPARHGFGPAASLRWATCLLCAGAAATLAAWLCLGVAPSHRPLAAGCAALLWGLCAALAWHWWRTLPTGQLAWDGAAWCIELAGRVQPLPLAAPPQVRLDLQRVMLVRARPLQAPALWLFLQRATPGPLQAETWAAIRRALYGHAPEAAGASQP